MPDSNLTKRALAAALKELMDEMPFEKIQVAHICERCGMNRKSFYYHFKDKYDLVNWIFDTDFISFTHTLSSVTGYDERIEIVKEICCYFYKNRKFYSKALKIEGQNSFSDHLWEYCRPILKLRLARLVGESDVDDFAVDFFTDACLCAIERWMQEKDCMPPEQFVDRLKALVQNGASAIHKEITQEQ